MGSADADFPHQLLEYRNGFLVSKTMFTACELGVFDLLLDVKEPISASAIANQLGTNVDATDSLLTACVALKLLKAEIKNNESFYSNTDMSALYLGKKSPKSIYYMMIFFSHTAYNCSNFLPEAVRDGKCQYERALGTTSKDIYETLYRSEEDLLAFMRHMDCTWNLFGNSVIKAFDLSEFHTVYDLGGCTGAVAKMFLSSYPGSTVTVMDLPKVVQAAKKYFGADNDQRISFLEGDLFKDPIPEADLFILARITHNWPEEKSLFLLRKVYQSCKPGGAVLLSEVLINDDKSGPLSSLMFSVHMLVQTEGKEKTPSEYIKLCKDAGFKDVQVKVTGRMYGAILGRK
ncbi:acetylserotonin O-methyltransferase-like [Gastrophryne carolinensis]